MTEHQGVASGTKHCLLCSGDYPAEFVTNIISASATASVRMSPGSFREWLMEEARNAEPNTLRGQ